MIENDATPNIQEELERLRKENEELRQQRRALLLTLFPPDPSAPFNPDEYEEIDLDEMAELLQSSDRP